MTITHQIKSSPADLPEAGDIVSELSGLVAQAQALVGAGVGLPGIQDIGSQIANLAPAISQAGGSASISAMIGSLGQQMSSASMTSMAGLMTSLNAQLFQLTQELDQTNLSSVLHSHILDKLAGILHSAFQGQHSVQLTDSGIKITSSQQVMSTAPILPHNGKTTVSDGLAVSLGITGQAFGMLSDRRLKTEVRAHEPVLNRVLALRLKTFKVKSVNHETGEIIVGAEPRPSIGFIAQQFRKIFPNLVRRNGKYLEIEEGKIASVLVQALQEFVIEQRAEIEAIRKELAELKR